MAGVKKKATTKKKTKRVVRRKTKRIPKVEKEKATDKPTDNLLVPLEEYLKAGVHIGSQFKNGQMKKYIYKTRQDGLHIIDVKTIDERLRLAADFLAKYEPSRILVVAERLYARKPAKKFAEVIGAKAVIKRFIPGTLTNPNNPNYTEVDVVFVSDPAVDKQALIEARDTRIPVIAFADTNNSLRNVDIAVPLNNKGKKSLALAYWILAREILLRRGAIKSKSDFKVPLEDFEVVAKK